MKCTSVGLLLGTPTSASTRGRDSESDAATCSGLFEHAQIPCTQRQRFASG
jgi:hypothetical protein